MLLFYIEYNKDCEIKAMIFKYHSKFDKTSIN